MPNNLSCPACGGPVTPQANVDSMACPYCGSAVSIPPELRIKSRSEPAPASTAPPNPFSAAASVRLDDASRERSRFETEILTDGLRRAQPVAQTAARLYNSWILARHFLPGCITALIVTACLICAAGAGLVFWLGYSQGAFIAP